MMVPRCLLTALAVVGHGVISALAYPTDPFNTDLAYINGQAENSTGPFTDYPAVVKSRQNRVELRILPLGASIMEGWGSSTSSGHVILLGQRPRPQAGHVLELTVL